MSMEMITTNVVSGTIEVYIHLSVLDASNAAELKAKLKNIDTKDYERVVVNLEKVDFIDSSGIGALLSFYKQIGRQFTLRSPTPTVLSVLELLRLHRVFDIEQEIQN